MMGAGGRAYFDHAATAPLHPAAREAWLEACEVIGNPTGLHASARRVKGLLEDARESIAADVNAHPLEVVFTASASEADSVAVLGARGAVPGRDHVVVSAVEHPGVATVRDRVEQVRVLPVGPDARVLLDALPGLLDERVGVVSVQLVNGEVGAIQPVVQVAEMGHAVGALVHTDAVQALAQPGVDFEELGVDLLSLGAHKIGAPVGIGALLVRRGVRLPVAGLGSAQEGGVVSGTPSAALAQAFAAALRVTAAERGAAAARERRIRARIVAALAAVEGVRVNGPKEGRWQVPGIVHLTVDGARADDVLLLLDRAGVDASTGASCRAGLHQPSDVVLAMTGGDLDAASSSVRLSFGSGTSDDEVDRLIEAMPGAVAGARAARG